MNIYEKRLIIVLSTSVETFFLNLVEVLTISPPFIIIVPYASSLDPNETPSKSGSHPGPSCLTLRQHSHKL